MVKQFCPASGSRGTKGPTGLGRGIDFKATLWGAAAPEEEGFPLIARGLTGKGRRACNSQGQPIRCKGSDARRRP